MSEMNAEFAPGPTETFRVRRDQIDQQHGADKMAAGKNRNFKAAAFRRPPDEQTLEIALLRLMNTEMNLGERAGEDQRHRRGQTDDRQLQRRDKIDNLRSILIRIELIEETSTNFGFSFSTAEPGPVSLKNQAAAIVPGPGSEDARIAPAISSVEKVCAAGIFSGLSTLRRAFRPPARGRSAVASD